MRKLTKLTIILSCLFGLSLAAQATPITASDDDVITTTLYGDARDDNPGDLAVDVVITFSQVNGDWVAHFAVAISDATLATYGDGLDIQAFGFNLDYSGAVQIVNLSPNIYDADVSGGAVVGTGGTTVEFLVCDDQGPISPFSCTGNTSSSLSFDLILAEGAQFDTDMFSDATMFEGQYIYGDGYGQMAAHIIGFDGDCSGAVGGTYYGDNTAGTGGSDGDCSVSVPEPGTLSLLGLGLLGLALTRRRRKMI